MCAKTKGMQNVTLTFITNAQRSKTILAFASIEHEALIWSSVMFFNGKLFVTTVSMSYNSVKRNPFNKYVCECESLKEKVYNMACIQFRDWRGRQYSLRDVMLRKKYNSKVKKFVFILTRMQSHAMRLLPFCTTDDICRVF